MGPHNSKRISSAYINNKIPKNPRNHTSANLFSSVCEINMQVDKEYLIMLSLIFQTTSVCHQKFLLH